MVNLDPSWIVAGAALVRGLASLVSAFRRPVAGDRHVDPRRRPCERTSMRSAGLPAHSTRRWRTHDRFRRSSCRCGRQRTRAR